jgi:cytochrome d ubiquinol oxidase subunit I
MAFLDPRAFVPGISDLVQGNEKRGIMSYYEKIERGKIAIQTLADYKAAVKHFDSDRAAELRAKFEDETWMNDYFKYFGYGYYDNPKDLIPPVPVSFYSFHIMVGLGVHFMVMFILSLSFLYFRKLMKKRWFLILSIITIPLVYIASMAGWMVAEFGRQPWVIQDLMPTIAAVSQIDATSVKITFWLFVLTFSVLFLAEIRIMLSQIKKGPNTGG